MASTLPIFGFFHLPPIEIEAEDNEAILQGTTYSVLLKIPDWVKDNPRLDLLSVMSGSLYDGEGRELVHGVVPRFAGAHHGWTDEVEDDGGEATWAEGKDIHVNVADGDLFDPPDDSLGVLSNHVPDGYDRMLHDVPASDYYETSVWDEDDSSKSEAGPRYEAAGQSDEAYGGDSEAGDDAEASIQLRTPHESSSPGLGCWSDPGIEDDERKEFDRASRSWVWPGSIVLVRGVPLFRDKVGRLRVIHWLRQ